MLYFMLTKHGSDFNKPGIDIWTDRVLFWLHCTMPLHFQAVCRAFEFGFLQMRSAPCVMRLW